MFAFLLQFLDEYPTIYVFICCSALSLWVYLLNGEFFESNADKNRLDKCLPTKRARKITNDSSAAQEIRWIEASIECNRFSANIEINFAESSSTPLAWDGFANVPTRMLFENTGHHARMTAIYNDAGNRPSISTMSGDVVGAKFSFKTIRFLCHHSVAPHPPSNNIVRALNGQAFDMEMQLLAENENNSTPNRFLILSWFFAKNKSKNYSLEPLLKCLKYIRRPNTIKTIRKPFPLDRIVFQSARGFYGYNRQDCDSQQEIHHQLIEANHLIPIGITQLNAVIKSTPFFLISGFILVVSYFILMVAMCSQRHSVLFFFSGIFFIIAGLLMLIGIIMYISLFKSEVGSKLRPRSMFQAPLFTYRYGHSFILFIIGCISAEIVGTLNFFLFIQIREIGREKTIPCFLYASTSKDETDEKRINPIGAECKAPPPFKCQKHPSVPKAFFSPLTQRRYFFEKPMPKCETSQKNLAKSLNELYTEPAAEPGTLFPYDLPHEFPLTRSVSTTTDIFSNCSGGFASANTNSHKSLRMYTPQLNKRTANRQQQECAVQNRNYKSISRDGSRDSLNSNQMSAVATKGILTNREKSKDELFMEFCRRAGQRPKPKDIYYIDTAYDGATEKDVFVVENYATIRKNRRNSNLSGGQKITNVYNSNQSLKDSNNSTSNLGGGKKPYPMNNLFDTNSFGGSTERAAAFLNAARDNYFLHSRNNSRDSNLYASRTLPRDFLKRNIDYDLDEFTNRRISASGIYTPYNASMNLPTDTISAPKEFTDPTTDFYKKSYDTLASRNSRQRDAYTGSEDALSVHCVWPNAIPGSPASFSNRVNYTPSYSPNTQRKPTQMSTFYSQHFPRQVKQQTPNQVAYFPHERQPSSIQTRFNDNAEYENGSRTDNENGNGSSSGGSDECEHTFDLDRMERERRKSHASLFGVDVDFENGTPV